MANSTHVTVPGRRHRLWLLLVAVAVYAVVPQLGSFHQSVSQIRHAQLHFFLLAFATSMATYLAAAATYCLLAIRPLPYGVTVIVQSAGMFINRLLPAGLGALGVNYSYLRKKQHTATEAAAIIALNNVLGFLGNGVLLLAGVLLFRHDLPPLHRLHISRGFIALVVLVGAVGLLVALRPVWRRKVIVALKAFKSQISLYLQRRRRLIAALVTSCALTLSNVVTLWLCLRSVHVHTSLLLVLLALSFGVLVGAAAPTPGGLGGVEAGVTAALVVYHIPASSALAGVLLFRALTYWLALVLGAIAFIIVQRQHWLNLKY